ncbi:MAG: P-loop NTPase, partial [Hyphomicrobiaceae bacterium]
MSVSESQVLDQLRRIKGPDLEGNIIDLGLVSPILLRNGKAYFSITVPAHRAEELEPLRQAAEKVVREIPGIEGATAVLTADGPAQSPSKAAPSQAPAGESRRVQEARARAGTPAAARSHAPAAQPSAREARRGEAVAGIKYMIAVASGKGGVGKSTTAVNLALALQANGHSAGILDADVYGPSQPRLLGLTSRPDVGPGNKLIPPQGFGLKAMSMGFMVDEATPVIWRGPMVVQAL